MRILFAAALLAVSAAPATAQSLGGLLRTIDRVATGATRVAPGRALAGGLTALSGAADVASLKAALDKATAERTTAASSLALARPVVERLLMTMGCATSAKALHALNRDRLARETYRSVDDDLNYTAMGLEGVMTHDRRRCMQVARVAQLERPTLNSLSLRTYFVSPSSGEARNVTTSFRLMDGVWLIDRIGWFQSS